jgi:hypothetical protein
MARQRRLHLTFDPPVTAQLGDYRVTFLGVALLHKRTLLEYVSEPPLPPFYPFRPAFEVRITDGIRPMPMNSYYENMAHPEMGAGRAATHFYGRPSAEANTMRIEVRAAPEAEADVFEVALPRDHAAPWRPEYRDQETAPTTVLKRNVAPA